MRGAACSGLLHNANASDTSRDCERHNPAAIPYADSRQALRTMGSAVRQGSLPLAQDLRQVWLFPGRIGGGNDAVHRAKDNHTGAQSLLRIQTQGSDLHCDGKIGGKLRWPRMGQAEQGIEADNIRPVDTHDKADA